MAYKKQWILALCFTASLSFAAAEIPRHTNRQELLKQDPSTHIVSSIEESFVSNQNNDNNELLLERRDHYQNEAYNRPRSHRRLTNQPYIHVDVADSFSSRGKQYVSILFLAVWALFMIPKCPKKKAAISAIGAVLMIVLRRLLKETGHGPLFEWGRVLFWKPLIVLFGLMLTTIGIDRTEYNGLIQRAGSMLEDPLPWKRCIKIMILATIGSAVVSRNMIVYLFSEIVVDLCVRNNVGDPMPYLLSLSTAANIGSAMTLTGTSSNLLIATLPFDPISWLDFSNNLLLPMIVSSIMNFLLIMIFYRSELFHGSPGASSSGQVYEMIEAKGADEECNEEEQEGDYIVAGELPGGWSLWSTLQVLVVGAFFTCFAAGLNIQKVSTGLGACMMILAFCNRRYYSGGSSSSTANNQADNHDENGEGADRASSRIEFDYWILITQLGRFLIVGSFNDTGIPQFTFNLTMDRCAEQMTNELCLYPFVVVIAALSTLFSSLGVVQMSAATFPYATPYDWVQVSFAANMGGNLAVYGSSSHYTMGDQFAKRTGKPSPRTFRSCAIFGAVSGLLSLFMGTYLLSYFHTLPQCSVSLGECVRI
ncbi:MAG: hypothetical protein SGBAC_009104 [Bacillariaceae sp.]